MSILTLFFYTCITGLTFYGLINLRKRRANRLPPGPIPWPIIGNLMHLGKLPHHSLAVLAKKYGPLTHLRLGSVDVVVAASATVAAQFLKVHDANFANRPLNSGAKHMAYNYHDMVFAPYGPRWRMLRKMCSMHLFSAKALTDFLHVRQVLYFHFFMICIVPIKINTSNVCIQNELVDYQNHKEKLYI